ncbi:activating transcription factor 7-interacting protein 1 [Trichonephila inaurata madagascariensis]|uniref:Activating transcription factor 7-interacting protein 1 n=1 Tax=Trichonephila inaurata madagascariensis TaxID=2747483 RepID=A0A8X7C627_9ARAC|nr:activating transcription factor 7-interacting protein 1 [Trichonephila inaurata madagascariensis]
MNKNFSEGSSNKKLEKLKVTEIEETKISRPIENHDKSVSVKKDELSKELILKENEANKENDVSIENKEINSIIPEKTANRGTQRKKKFTSNKGKPKEKINVSVSKIIQTVVDGAFNPEILENGDLQRNQDSELNSGHTNEGLNDAKETSLESTGTNNRSSNNDTLYSQSKAVGDLNIINKLHNDVNSYAENKNLSVTSETTDTSESNNYLNAMTSVKSTHKTDMVCCSEEKECLNDLIIGVCASVDMSIEVVKPDILIESENLSSSKNDSLDILTDNFEPIDSELDCFVVKDSSNVITIEDESKNELSEKQMNKNFSEGSSNKKLEKLKVTEIEETKISRPIENHDKSVSVKKDELSKELILKENEANKENDVSIENKEINSIIPEKTANRGTVCLENFVGENVERSNPAVNINSNLCSTEENIDNTSITSLNSLKFFSCDNDLVNVVSDEKNDSERNNLHSSQENEKTLTTNETSDVEGNISSDVNVDITDSNTDISLLLPDLSAELGYGSNFAYGSGDIEVITCLDDLISMVSKICTLHQRISEIKTQNGDVGAIEDLKNISKNEDSDENKLGIIASVKSCNSVMISLPSKKEKFLDTSSLESSEESKKRKLEDEKKPSSINKKLKEDNTLIDIEILLLEILKGIVFSDNFKKLKNGAEIKKSLLDYLSLKACRNKFDEDYKRILAFDVIRGMEDKIRELEDELLWLHSKRASLLSVQQGHFKAFNYRTQIPVRTVAVNVKIFRECDVLSKAPNEVKKVVCPGQKSLPVPNSSNKPQTNQESLPASAVSNSSNKPQTNFIAYKSKPGVVSNNISNPRGMIAPPASSCFTVKSPNVTVTGNAIASVMNRTPQAATPPRPALNAPKQNQPAKGCEVIDLTEEESTSEKSATSSALVPVSLPSNPKVNIPSGLQSSQNAIPPLSGLLQMIPSTTQQRPPFTLANSMQVQQVNQQTLIPSLPPGLLGSRVTYIVPSNSGQINSFGRGNVPVSNFVPGANQRIPTFVVRITNPSSVAPLSTVVSTSARLPMIPQTLRSIKSSPLVSSPSSDIVLYSSVPKHPAPFPPVPEYPLNSQLKALPPKPCLKGSRSPNGIILSWNMVLGKEHAEIQNYQLFAYQEIAGPVLPSLWKKVGDVQALPLPMACTLTQFSEGNKYHFTVRAVDKHSRFGPFSDSVSILYTARNT